MTPPAPDEQPARGSETGGGPAGRPGAGRSKPPTTLAEVLGDGVKLPWLLRGPVKDGARPSSALREPDRLAALAARRTSLVVLPLVGVCWVVVAVVGNATALRIATITALVLCVTLGARAAQTTQRFRRRWIDPEDLTAPAGWVTLATVAGVLASIVAIANLVADLQDDRAAVASTIISVVALGITTFGVYSHVAGGRSVGAALRDRGTSDLPRPS